ncbi:MAG: hypothetical protein LIO53_08950, partial [Oscillospiraceae bacterium]|nr:hypothetical protein [Oscillospiraceae bacterium]
VPPGIEPEAVIGVGTTYFFGNDGTSTSNYRYNESVDFNVSMTSASSEYETSFGIGVNKTGQNVRFRVQGKGGADDQQIKISVYQNSNDALLDSKITTVEQYNYRDIYFVGFKKDYVYYVVVEPVNFSESFSANIEISKGD